jgi:hypothetical protein
MNIWKYSGSTLTFSACVLENPKDPLAFKPQGFYFDAQDPMQPMDSSNLKEQKSKDDEDLFVFLCMCFVQSLIITGGEDGFVRIYFVDRIDEIIRFMFGKISKSSKRQQHTINIPSFA